MEYLTIQQLAKMDSVDIVDIVAKVAVVNIVGEDAWGGKGVPFILAGSLAAAVGKIIVGGFVEVT